MNYLKSLQRQEIYLLPGSFTGEVIQHELSFTWVRMIKPTRERQRRDSNVEGEGKNEAKRFE